MMSCRTPCHAAGTSRASLIIDLEGGGGFTVQIKLQKHAAGHIAVNAARNQLSARPTASKLPFCAAST